VAVGPRFGDPEFTVEQIRARKESAWKRIVLSDQAKADTRPILRVVVMHISWRFTASPNRRGPR
jgi:hypothetical protein